MHLSPNQRIWEWIKCLMSCEASRREQELVKQQPRGLNIAFPYLVVYSILSTIIYHLDSISGPHREYFRRPFVSTCNILPEVKDPSNTIGSLMPLSPCFLVWKGNRKGFLQHQDTFFHSDGFWSCLNRISCCWFACLQLPWLLANLKVKRTTE
jgi:hypothetical protein